MILVMLNRCLFYSEQEGEKNEKVPGRKTRTLMSWELYRNRGHNVLSPESHGASVGHPDLPELGSVPISAAGTLGGRKWSKERVND